MGLIKISSGWCAQGSISVLHAGHIQAIHFCHLPEYINYFPVNHFTLPRAACYSKRFLNPFPLTATLILSRCWSHFPLSFSTAFRALAFSKSVRHICSDPAVRAEALWWGSECEVWAVESKARSLRIAFAFGQGAGVVWGAVCKKGDLPDVRCRCDVWSTWCKTRDLRCERQRVRWCGNSPYGPLSARRLSFTIYTFASTPPRL